LLGSTRVAMTSSQSQTGNTIERNGVRGTADVDGMAARRENEVGVLVWNYHDDDVNAPGAEVRLEVKNLPAKDRVLVEQYRVDAIQSNAFAAWNAMGSPQRPTLEQYQKLEAAGQLQLAGSPKWSKIEQGHVTLKFVQPRQGLSLFRIDW
jgi:xylan 1,4-beta-xylosidase